MAEKDPWSDYAPQPGAAPAAAGAPASPEGEDPWAAYAPGVDYSDLKTIPQAFRDRLVHGQSLGAVADAQGLKQDGSWHSIWDAAKEGASAGYDAENLANTFRDQRKQISDFVGPNGDRFGGWSMLESGVEAGENFYHVLKGAFVGTSAAASQAVANAAGSYGNPNASKDAIEMVTRPYSPDIPSISDLAAQTMAFETLPAIVGRNGEFARVTRDPETGKLGAQVVGTMPQPLDFKEAAASIPSHDPVATEARVKAQWDLYGRHPHEVEEAAANSPTHANDLGAAKAPVLPLPERPSKTYIQEVDDGLFKLKTSHQADMSEMMERLGKMGEITPELDGKLYAHMEGDTSVRLTPEEAKFFNEHILPLKQEEFSRWERLKATEIEGIDGHDPTYMHRMLVGKTPQLDRLAGEGQNTNVVYGHGGVGVLARQTSSMQPRTYFSLTGEDGARTLVRMSNDGKSVRSVGAAEKLAYDSTDEKLTPGKEITIDGKSYQLGNAFTREIEANTSNKYYKSGIANTIDNLVRLRSAERATYRIQQMRDTPEWQEYTARSKSAAKADDWVTPEMPQFHNDWMDPKIAHVIDDFHGDTEHNSVFDKLEKINNYAIGSLFWTPIPHALNAGAFWTMDRAWENVTPSGVRSLFVNGAKAIREVATQGPRYQRALREGGSLQYAPIVNRDFYPKLLQKVGQEIDKHEEGWEGLAKAIGTGPADLYTRFMAGSNKALWMASDVFKMQRILELEDKGMSTSEAVQHTERYTPTYRMPSEIFGDRMLRQIYNSPAVFEFSRYHYDIMRTYANMARDLAVGNTEQKLRAAGSILTLGAMQLVLWPALSAMTQYLTGNDDLRVPSFGPGRLTEPLFGMLVNNTPFKWPDFIQKYYGDENKTFLDSMRGLIPMSPGATMALDLYTNRYSFTGRPVAEPADVRNGNVKKVIGQEIEHAGRTLVEPYNVFADAWKHDEGPGEVLLKNIFGLQKHGEKEEQAKQRAFKFQNREAISRTRENKAVGPLEYWINQAPIGGE